MIRRMLPRLFESTVGKNFAYLLAAQIVIYIIAFFQTILIARNYSVADYGKFSFILAVCSIIAAISVMGQSTLIIRDVAQNKSLASRYAANSSLITVLSGIFLVVVTYIGLLLFYPFDWETRLLYILVSLSFVILAAINVILVSISRAFEKMQYEAFSSCLASASVFALVLVVIFLGKGVFWLGAAILTGGVVSLAYLITIWLKNLISPELRMERGLIRYLLVNGWPLVLNSVFVMVYGHIDILMLAKMKGEFVVGYYSAAHRLYQMSGVVPILALTVLFPVLSRYFVDNVPLFKETSKRLMWAIIIYGGIVIIFLLIFANPIISIVFGSRYENSVDILRILSLGCIFSYLTSFCGTVLRVLNLQKRLAIATACGAIVNILLNLALIPEYSAAGAAIATVVSRVVVLIAAGYWVYNSRNLIGVKPDAL